MIGCVACEHSDTCFDAFTEVSCYCGKLIEQAEKEYEDALEKIEGIARGIDDIEKSYQDK